MWLLPLYFLSDFFDVFVLDRNLGAVNSYAHIGGFLAGSLFHFFIGRPLKNKYYPDKFDFRRWYLMAVSLTVYSVMYYYMSYLKNEDT